MAAGDPVNTYDLFEIADLGLVYTTTVGLEMAMSGVPVIVVGKTHYRGKGFTLTRIPGRSSTPCWTRSWLPPQSTASPIEQVARAWKYAYRFYFEYPLPFPWHLLHFWDELETWPVKRVLSPEGQALFGDVFRYLAGEPRDVWGRAAAEGQAVASAPGEREQSS